MDIHYYFSFFILLLSYACNSPKPAPISIQQIGPASRQLQFSPIALSKAELTDSSLIALEQLGQKSCACLAHFKDSLRLFLQDAKLSLDKMNGQGTEHPADLLQQIVHHPKLPAVLGFGRCLSIAQSQSPQILNCIQAKQKQQLPLKKLLALELLLIEEQMGQSCPEQQALFQDFNKFGQAMNRFQYGE